MDLSPFAVHWESALPGILLVAAALLVMVADIAIRGPERDGLAVIGVLGCAAAAGAALWLWPGVQGVEGFQNTLRADGYAVFFAIVVSAGAALTLLMSVDYLREHPLPEGEYYALVLLASSGMVFMAAANDLIVIFLALEIMSVAVYVLAGMLRTEARSAEAAVKYFLLGAFASAFLLYGIAFFYGATG